MYILSLDALSSFQPACPFLPCRWLPWPACLYLLPCLWLPYQSACACFPVSNCMTSLLVLFALSLAALSVSSPLVIVALSLIALSSLLVLVALSMECNACLSLLPCIWLSCPVRLSLQHCLWLPSVQSACPCCPVSGCSAQF